MHNWNILEIFENYKWPGIAFLIQSSRCISDEQPCLKTIGLYDDLSFLPSLFFSISYSVFLFHLSCVFQFFCLFFCGYSFSSFYQAQKKSLAYLCVYVYYTYIYSMYNIYFWKFTNFCLAKKSMTFWFHLFDLTDIEC